MHWGLWGVLHWKVFAKFPTAVLGYTHLKESKSWLVQATLPFVVQVRDNCSFH